MVTFLPHIHEAPTEPSRPWTPAAGDREVALTHTVAALLPQVPQTQHALLATGTVPIGGPALAQLLHTHKTQRHTHGGRGFTIKCFHGRHEQQGEAQYGSLLDA